VHVPTQPCSPPPFAATVLRRPGAVVVAVQGELDPLTAPTLREVLDESLEEQPGAVVVDLRGLTLLASAGLAALIAAHDRAVPQSRLRIVASDITPAMRTIHLTSLHDVLSVHATVEDALAAYGEYVDERPPQVLRQDSGVVREDGVKSDG